MTEKWRKCIDQNQVVGVLFIDFGKAFDSIDHMILMKKLQACGISVNLYEWVLNYLEDRSQYTTIEDTKSDFCNVDFGVPQGSLLGPKLFSISSSDLPQISTDFEIDMFADDTTAFCISGSVDSVMIKIDCMVSKISKWANVNGLSIHPGKSKIMILSSKVFVGPLPIIKLDGSEVEIVSNVTCLGVKIDDKLLWSEHVRNVSKNFNAKLKNLYSMRSLPSDSLKTIYFQGILPSVLYAIVIWGNCCDSLLNELEHIHCKAANK